MTNFFTFVRAGFIVIGGRIFIRYTEGDDIPLPPLRKENRYMNGIITACASGDKRLDFAAEIISSALGKVIFPTEEAKEPICDGILLPIPTKRYLAEKPEEFSILLSHLKRGGYIFCSDASLSPSEFADYKITSYATDEDFMGINTIATCEGALSIMIAETEKTLRCSRVLITGWGRLAKCLFFMLKRLNADVGVCARSRQARAEALTLGCDCGDICDIPYMIKSSDIIVNTIPAEILKKEDVTCSLSGKLFLELASAPYGFDRGSLSALGAKCVLAPALPSKFAPESSGKALGRAVCRLYSVDNTI